MSQEELNAAVDFNDDGIVLLKEVAERIAFLRWAKNDYKGRRTFGTNPIRKELLTNFPNLIKFKPSRVPYITGNIKAFSPVHP